MPSPRRSARELRVGAGFQDELTRAEKILIISAECLDVASGVQLWGRLLPPEYG